MKKIRIYMIIGMLYILCSSFTQSTNYFTEGTAWYYRVTSIPPKEQVDFREYLEGEFEIGGYKATGYWKENLTDKTERMLYTYIRTEGDKVYFLENKEVNEWKLFYDFGLQVGDTATVWSFNGAIDYAPLIPLEHFVECREVSNTSDFHPEMGKMLIRYYFIKNKYEESPQDFTDEGVWIVGLGNPLCPKWNAMWNPYGGILEMLEISHKDEVLYRAPGYTGVASMPADALNIQVDKGTMRIQPEVGDPIMVVGSDGKSIHGECGVYTNLPSGVYYVVRGAMTKSVIVP